MIRKDIDLKELEVTLKARRSMLLSRLRTDGNASTSEAVNPDRADLAQDYLLKDRRLALADRLEATLKQVEKALEKIKTGLYGKCEHCGENISGARLKALPYAELCIACQQEEEKTRYT